MCIRDSHDFKEEYTIYLWVHSNPCVLKTSWPKNYSTIQHQKYYIFDVKNFTQNLKVTLDRVPHDHHVLFNKHAVIAENAI